jgi:hypothetical protein
MKLLATDGYPVTTRCPTRCVPNCDFGAACHERHWPEYVRDHDPDDCEERRAALDAHSRLSAELEGSSRD